MLFFIFQVSWIRTNELSILTSNIFTFTSDPRFSVEHPDGDSAAWGLKVSGVRLEDAGEYECQVSTLTKLRHTVRLTVKGNDVRCTVWFTLFTPLKTRQGRICKTL